MRVGEGPMVAMLALDAPTPTPTSHSPPTPNQRPPAPLLTTMDIQQWLAATTDRAPPQPSDDHHIPDAFRAHPHPHSPDRQLPRGRSYRRKKRTGASSDSSLIPPRRADRGVGQPAACSLPSERGRPVRSSGRGSDRSRSVSTSAFASLSPEPAPEKTYERRPRHKTRPDRYEPRSKKQKGHHDVRKEKKSGKKRRKSHRGGDGGRTAGLVQSFQLRNGPKNSRLTVRGATLRECLPED